MPRHFISLHDLSAAEFRRIISRANELKNNKDPNCKPLKGKVLAMVFEKPSTRTRIAFEAGMAQLGGSAIFLSPGDTQIGRGEDSRDSARVISSMVDCIVLRTCTHQTITDFAQHSTVPVINGLSDLLHPCELLADMQTFWEQKGDISGKTVAWIGDGNNMCHSYINAAKLLGFNLHIACPKDYRPDPSIVASAGEWVRFFATSTAAAANADLLATDVWASMGQESDSQQRRQNFAEFQVTAATMNCANEGAIFTHCLPAHRGEEVTAEVIDGEQSVAFTVAENRLHSQKALLEFLLC